MADNEIRFVHREETFNDLAVRELAKGRSACICRLQFGRCTRDECRTCAISRQYNHCYRQMNDYDKQRLSTYVSEYYLQDSYSPSAWMSHSRLIWHTLFCIFIALLLIIGGPFLVSKAIPSDMPESYGHLKSRIIRTMIETNKKVKDLNYDGEVNCYDYACTFKLCWDRLYSDCKDACILIHNKQNGVMNHLFVGIRYDGQYIEVETWAPNIYRYKMEENWSKRKYNRRYNLYGETKHWLSKIKDRSVRAELNL